MSLTGGGVWIISANPNVAGCNLLARIDSSLFTQSHVMHAAIEPGGGKVTVTPLRSVPVGPFADRMPPPSFAPVRERSIRRIPPDEYVPHTPNPKLMDQSFRERMNQSPDKTAPGDVVDIIIVDPPFSL